MYGAFSKAMVPTDMSSTRAGTRPSIPRGSSDAYAAPPCRSVEAVCDGSPFRRDRLDAGRVARAIEHAVAQLPLSSQIMMMMMKKARLCAPPTSSANSVIRNIYAKPTRFIMNSKKPASTDSSAISSRSDRIVSAVLLEDRLPRMFGRTIRYLNVTTSQSLNGLQTCTAMFSGRSAISAFQALNASRLSSLFVSRESASIVEVARTRG